MKKIFVSLLVLLLSINVYSQDISRININEYKLDSNITSLLVEKTKRNNKLNIYQENNNIYVLGWSKDGKLAYVQDKKVEGRGGSDLYFTIQDMVSGKNVYYKKIEWYDRDNDNSDLQAFYKCIKTNSAEFNKNLKANKIIIKPVKTELLSPAGKNDVNVEFEILNETAVTGEFGVEYSDYEIAAFKGDKYKVICEIKKKQCSYVMATSYIRSPYEDRIALIVADAEYVYEGEEVFVNFLGVDLSKGFLEDNLKGLYDFKKLPVKEIKAEYRFLVPEHIEDKDYQDCRTFNLDDHKEIKSFLLYPYYSHKIKDQKNKIVINSQEFVFDGYLGDTPHLKFYSFSYKNKSYLIFTSPLGKYFDYEAYIFDITDPEKIIFYPAQDRYVEADFNTNFIGIYNNELCFFFSTRRFDWNGQYSLSPYYINGDSFKKLCDKNGNPYFVNYAYKYKYERGLIIEDSSIKE
ncbi:MAG: hypothetical protein IK002_06305 [Treponema sp.]|uniref:hypothetical protein n=1 Tax=Treponema sp. TaxID=166 RepID=UPI00298E57E5|nr:hypothetical protein [Treponema sp.]MBR5933585.1 hypothetical protein [Treponema sp.]